MCRPFVRSVNQNTNVDSSLSFQVRFDNIAFSIYPFIIAVCFSSAFRRMTDKRYLLSSVQLSIMNPGRFIDVRLETSSTLLDLALLAF